MILLRGLQRGLKPFHSMFRSIYLTGWVFNPPNSVLNDFNINHECLLSFVIFLTDLKFIGIVNGWRLDKPPMFKDTLTFA